MKKIKKLTLNKDVVSNLTQLSSDSANNLVGGGTAYGMGCDSFWCSGACSRYSCSDCPDSDNCASVVWPYC